MFHAIIRVEPGIQAPSTYALLNLFLSDMRADLKEYQPTLGKMVRVRMYGYVG